MTAWLWLAASIVAEVIATSSLKLADGFTKLVPSIVVVVGYGFSFWGTSFALKAIPLAVVYAIWSGLGTVGVLFVGKYIFGEALGWQQYVGAAVVVAGVVLLSIGRTGAHA